MNPISFDRLTRALIPPASRRSVLVALSLAIPSIPDNALAKKRKKKRVKRNAFGCVNVGNFCKNNGQCCSNICQGKKGKKECRAHDESTCRAGQIEGFCGGVSVLCVSTAGAEGSCDTTTGKAGYCTAAGNCFACTKDADCVPFCGPQAACVVCENVCALSNLSTACVGPALGGCTFPT